MILTLDTMPSNTFLILTEMTSSSFLLFITQTNIIKEHQQLYIKQ